MPGAKKSAVLLALPEDRLAGAWVLRDPGDLDLGVALAMTTDLSHTFFSFVANRHYFTSFNFCFDHLGRNFNCGKGWRTNVCLIVINQQQRLKAQRFLLRQQVHQQGLAFADQVLFTTSLDNGFFTHSKNLITG